MGLFWRRNGGSDFISLGLNIPDAPAAEPVAEKVIEKTEEQSARQASAAHGEMPAAVYAPPSSSAVQSPESRSGVEETVEDESFLQRFRKAVSATRENITSRLEDAVK